MSKILPTIGPKTEKLEDIKKVMDFSDFLRLNGTHNTLDWHKEIINVIQRTQPKVPILFDIPGRKIRTLSLDTCKNLQDINY